MKQFFSSLLLNLGNSSTSLYLEIILIRCSKSKREWRNKSLTLWETNRIKFSNYLRKLVLTFLYLKLPILQWNQNCSIILSELYYLFTSLQSLNRLKKILTNYQIKIKSVYNLHKRSRLTDNSKHSLKDFKKLRRFLEFILSFRVLKIHHINPNLSQNKRKYRMKMNG